MWASTLLVSSLLAAHQVFLGGPHDAAGLSRGRSAAAVQPTCVQIFRSDSGSVYRAWAVWEAHLAIQASSACFRPICCGGGHTYFPSRQT